MFEGELCSGALQAGYTPIRECRQWTRDSELDAIFDHGWCSPREDKLKPWHIKFMINSPLLCVLVCFGRHEQFAHVFTDVVLWFLLWTGLPRSLSSVKTSHL